MSDAIIINGLTKTFGSKVAVNNLDLRIPAGSLCGFIGPNGAGKTTTIRMIMSIIFPDKGQLSVLGRPSAIESKDRIGYLPEERGVYKKMKVGAFLTYMAKLKGVDPSAAKKKTNDWLAKVGLADVAKKKCEELSKGMQQKVQFIAAVVHEPDLLILDEVFSGLDPVNRVLMRGLIDEQHRRGCTIVFSTHAMYEAEQLCERVFMIHNGVKVLDDTLEGIRARFDPKTIVVEPIGASMDVITRITESIRGRASLSPTGVNIEVDPFVDLLTGVTTPAEVAATTIEELRGTGTSLPLDVSVEPRHSNIVHVRSTTPEIQELARVASLHGVASVQLEPEGLHVRVHEGADQSGVFASLAAALPLRRIELKRVNLEDVFIDLVNSSGQHDVSREDLRERGSTIAAEVARV